MQLSNSVLATMKSAARPRLRWWQLSLRTLLALLTLAGVVAFFHEPISAWAANTWQHWFPSVALSTPPLPPTTLKYCPGCGMG